MKMARKKRTYRRRTTKKKRRRTKDRRVPLLTVLPPVFSAVIDPVMHGKDALLGGDAELGLKMMADRLSENFLGVWVTQPEAGFVGWERPMRTYMSIFLGAIGSKIATSLGVNRSLKKVPFLGKYIKL